MMDAVSPKRAPAGEAPTRSTWLAVVAIGLGSFASVTAEFLPVGVLPDVAASFDVSPGYAGLMMAMPGLLAAFAAPGVMLLAGETDRRRVLLLLSAVLLAACLLSAWAPTFWVMLVGRAAVGVSLGAFWAVGLAAAVRLVDGEYSHKAAGIVFAGVTAAMILGVPLGTLVAQYFSWRGAFLASALIAAAALVMQLVTLPRIDAGAALRFGDLTAFVARPAAQASMAIIALIFAAHFGTYTYLAPLLAGSGLSASAITAVLLGYGVAGFISNYVASQTVGRHLKLSLLSATLLLGATLVVLPLLGQSVPTQIGAVMLWGLAWGALPLCLNSWHRERTGSTDAAAAMFTFITQVGIAIGSTLGGRLVDGIGLTADYVGGAVLVAASLVILLRAKK